MLEDIDGDEQQEGENQFGLYFLMRKIEGLDRKRDRVSPLIVNGCHGPRRQGPRIPSLASQQPLPMLTGPKTGGIASQRQHVFSKGPRDTADDKAFISASRDLSSASNDNKDDHLSYDLSWLYAPRAKIQAKFAQTPRLRVNRVDGKFDSPAARHDTPQTLTLPHVDFNKNQAEDVGDTAEKHKTELSLAIEATKAQGDEIDDCGAEDRRQRLQTTPSTFSEPPSDIDMSALEDLDRTGLASDAQSEHDIGVMKRNGAGVVMVQWFDEELQLLKRYRAQNKSWEDIFEVSQRDYASSGLSYGQHE